MNRNFLSIAALLGALSVVLGAFAAHKLKAMTSPETVAIFETGVRYMEFTEAVNLSARGGHAVELPLP